MASYTISWSDPAEHVFDILLSFRAPADEPRLLLPAWRPGRYLIQNYAANVRQWSATTAEGSPLKLEKEGKSSWRLSAAAEDEAVVRYRFFAGVLDAGSSFLDETEAYFNGINLFMMVEGMRDEIVRLTVAAPPDWRIETQLTREESNVFTARDYDHLVDSPVICAPRVTRYSFTEQSASIHLVFVNDDRVNTEQFVDPVRSIVREQAAMFGGLPLSDYRFLVHVGDKWHGVEHEESCSIIAKRSDLLAAGRGDAGYDHFLSICSHEFFHVWNVKRILPARFAPYDYSTEALTRLLWVMEGLTSYFGDLTLVRSGLWSEARYLRHLGEAIETLESNPARLHVSLEQASFDSWLQNDAHDRTNSVISFYNKGEIVGALLDLAILRATDGRKSLVDVMQQLWTEYGRSGRGMAENAFERAVRAVAEVGGFFEKYVSGVEPLPYEELLGAAGVGIESQTAAARGIGAALRSEGGRLLVNGAMAGGAGAAAGLLPGDEILAIDGTRTTAEGEMAAILHGAAESPVEMIVSRGGMVRQLSLPTAADPRRKVTLHTTGSNTLREQWLRRAE